MQMHEHDSVSSTLQHWNWRLKFLGMHVHTRCFEFHLNLNSIKYVFLFSTVVDCGALTDPANGQVSHPDGTTFGQTATYSCNPDYNLMGDSTRTCEATGDWSGSEPTCQCNSFNSSFCSYNTQSETASQDRESMTAMLTEPTHEFHLI